MECLARFFYIKFSQVFAIFFIIKVTIFSNFLKFLVIFWVSLDSRATELPLGFDNIFLHSLWMLWNVFQDFNITNLGNFLKYLRFFHVFGFFRHQRPWDLLQCLMISCCIVSRVNGMVINIFLTPMLVIFG